MEQALSKQHLKMGEESVCITFYDYWVWTHRSQLLYRLVQSLFGHTYDYSIVISSYSSISFAENRTYSRTLSSNIKQIKKACKTSLYRGNRGNWFHFKTSPATQIMMVGSGLAQPLPPHYFLSCLQLPAIKMWENRLRRQKSNYSTRNMICAPWTDPQPSDVPQIFQEFHVFC